MSSEKVNVQNTGMRHEMHILPGRQETSVRTTTCTWFAGLRTWLPEGGQRPVRERSWLPEDVGDFCVNGPTPITRPGGQA